MLWPSTRHQNCRLSRLALLLQSYALRSVTDWASPTAIMQMIFQGRHERMSTMTMESAFSKEGEMLGPPAPTWQLTLLEQLYKHEHLCEQQCMFVMCRMSFPIWNSLSLPVHASEQGNVIGLVSVYIYVYKKIVGN